MPPTTSLRALVCALCLALLPALPAHAETRTKRDPAGDAPARIDITQVRYSYTSSRVRARARVPELGGAGQAALGLSRFEIFEAGYAVRLRKRAGEPARVRLLYYDHFELKRQKCPGVRGSWGDSVVRLSVPTRCLEGHARRKVYVHVGVSRGEDVDVNELGRRLRRD